MQVKHKYTKAGQSPYATIAFKTVMSDLRTLDGRVLSSLPEFEAPENWSQVACDILAQKFINVRGKKA